MTNLDLGMRGEIVAEHWNHSHVGSEYLDDVGDAEYFA